MAPLFVLPLVDIAFRAVLPFIWLQEEVLSIASENCSLGTLIDFKEMLPGLRRCGKNCTQRLLNYLRPNLKHGEFTNDEDKNNLQPLCSYWKHDLELAMM